MQSMHSPGSNATAPIQPITLDCLCEAFTTLPDPRRGLSPHYIVGKFNASPRA